MSASLPIRIEPMRLSDLPEVMAIEAVSFSAPWSEAAYRQELESNPNAHYLVARLARATVAPEPASRLPPIIGYGGMWYQYDEAHITTLAVQPSWRGRGVGTRLLLSLLVRATEAGMAFVTLEVRLSNVVAQRLYEKHGFRVTGYRRRYYIDNGEDALIMSTPPLTSPSWRQALMDRWRAVQDETSTGLPGNNGS